MSIPEERLIAGIVERAILDYREMGTKTSHGFYDICRKCTNKAGVCAEQFLFGGGAEKFEEAYGIDLNIPYIRRVAKDKKQFDYIFKTKKEVIEDGLRIKEEMQGEEM